MYSSALLPTRPGTHILGEPLHACFGDRLRPAVLRRLESVACEFNRRGWQSGFVRPTRLAPRDVVRPGESSVKAQPFTVGGVGVTPAHLDSYGFERE